MGFFMSFLKKKVKDTKSNIIEMLVKFDPESATEAEIDAMYSNFVKLTETLEDAKVSLNKEENEAKVIKENYNKKLEMLQVLKDKQSNPEVDQTELSEAIEILLNDLNDMKPRVVQEMEEAVEARKYFETISDAVNTAKEKILVARKNLETAQKRMKLAEIKSQQAKDRENKIRELAGLSQVMDKSNIALSAMTERAEKLEREANASVNRAKLLEPEKKKENSLLSELENLNTKVHKSMTLDEQIENLKL